MKAKSLWERLEDACGAIRKKVAGSPEIAIVLGTGLGNLARRVKAEAVFPYAQIPHFPVSTVESHKGELIFGELSGKRVAVMAGRQHVYEGYSMPEVAFPIQVLARLGTKVLIVTNASGGLNLKFKLGQIILIEDHINLMGTSPLVGPNEDRLGPRFPDLSQPYSARLLELTEKAGREKQLELDRGVYAAVVGPNLETRAEYRFLRGVGADLVGMSCVPEVLAGVHAGLEILGIGVVTDLCDPDHLEPVDIKNVIRVAGEAGPKLDQLIEATIKKL